MLGVSLLPFSEACTLANLLLKMGRFKEALSLVAPARKMQAGISVSKWYYWMPCPGGLCGYVSGVDIQKLLFVLSRPLCWCISFSAKSGRSFGCQASSCSSQYLHLCSGVTTLDLKKTSGFRTGLWLLNMQHATKHTQNTHTNRNGYLELPILNVPFPQKLTFSWGDLARVEDAAELPVEILEEAGLDPVSRLLNRRRCFAVLLIDLKKKSKKGLETFLGDVLLSYHLKLELAFGSFPSWNIIIGFLRESIRSAILQRQVLVFSHTLHEIHKRSWHKVKTWIFDMFLNVTNPPFEKKHVGLPQRAALACLVLRQS